MAGEGDTWHDKCHTHKLHVIYMLREEDMWGDDSPPTDQSTKRKKRQKRMESGGGRKSGVGKVKEGGGCA